MAFARLFAGPSLQQLVGHDRPSERHQILQSVRKGVWVTGHLGDYTGSSKGRCKTGHLGDYTGSSKGRCKTRLEQN